MSTVDDVCGELGRLRRGYGVRSPRSEAEVGPGLRALCGIESHDDPALVRTKLQAGLTALLTELSPDEQRVASAALGLHPDATGVLARRVEWLAQTIDVSERTVMRRIQETLRLLAEVAVTRGVAIRSTPRPGAGWVAQKLRTLVRLDKHATEVIQERTILATRDDVETINEVVGLPGPAEGTEMEILYGGVLRSVERRSSHFRYVIDLPVALMRGESHSYAVHFRLPEGQRYAYHYVVMPSVQMRDFTLRIRFDRSRLPRHVWRVEDASHREIDNPDLAGTVMRPDRAGEITAEFHDLSPAVAYGVAVEWDEEALQPPAAGASA
jgi:hypothetical protein